jgi:FAD/FMN-containing dehydrogenase
MPGRPEQGVVFNLATQGKPGPDAHAWMIAAAVGRMIQEAAGPHGFGLPAVAMPEIGCGLGGLALTDLLSALMPYERAPVDLVVVSYSGRQS